MKTVDKLIERKDWYQSELKKMIKDDINGTLEINEITGRIAELKYAIKLIQNQ